jgi:hypothetical protein
METKKNFFHSITNNFNLNGNNKTNNNDSHKK